MTASQTANCGPDDASFHSFWPTCSTRMVGTHCAAGCFSSKRMRRSLHARQRVSWQQTHPKISL